MAVVPIKVPKVSESISEGILASWLKPDGAVVKAGEPLYELETDKASQVFIAPAAGTLKIQVPEGDDRPGRVRHRLHRPRRRPPSAAAEGARASRGRAPPPPPSRRRRPPRSRPSAESSNGGRRHDAARPVGPPDRRRDRTSTPPGSRGPAGAVA